ncbi:hypothetical protein FDECE_9255 [Fusarium decemcellulare]|nr:hypothetical protein FDECE_9255 [Fusarium decemcellulare]
MKIPQLFTMYCSALVLAMPKDDIPHQLAKRQDAEVDQPDNPRLGVDTCFRIEKVKEGVEYFDCPAKKPLNEQGGCSANPTKEDNWCETYCQKSLKWGWGQEVPFDNARCGPGACTLEDRMQAEVSRSITWGLQIGHGAFTAGASFSYSESKMTVSGVVRNKPSDLEEECGYWAFVPHTITSCGITAKGELDMNAFSGKKCNNVVEKEECYTTIMETSEGNPSGFAVFVATDCADPTVRLPFCKQDKIYLKEGVSYDKCPYLMYHLAWADMDDESKGLVDGFQQACEENNWPPDGQKDPYGCTP